MAGRIGGGSRKAIVAGALALVLAGCQADELGYGPKHLRQVSSDVKARLDQLDMSLSSPIMLRIYKQESELEVWKQTRSGRYALLDTFEICKWSGKLGPKKKEGDRQAPEGFYEITPALMNPNSSYHLAFNLGYPNKFDRAYGRTGSNLMVHGACSSRGCYAMTDAQVQDIYALARESFKGGQRSFQVQAFPFHMTAENMAKHRDDENYGFWQMLKRGYDHFEVTKTPPKIDVCEKRYVFDAVPLVEGVPFRATAKCPAFEVPASVARAVEKKQLKDEAEVTRIAEAEARSKRREEAIASFFGADTDKDDAAAAGDATQTASTDAGAGAETATASAPMSAVPAVAPAREQAFAATPEKSSGSFFGRFFSSGDKEASATPSGVADPDAPRPAAKP
ncbi:MAG: transcriptional regulator [Stappia sp.]|uniref:L,D-transpeptidase family protein n=1 Tax=Stappia sp. TaxID=1870903 RepID=UPI000C6978C8|nr:murein L,D-transpeptidase family protein [Stappia sp.]MBM21386.1 transcriptional regulator [Stappia sp.]